MSVRPRSRSGSHKTQGASKARAGRRGRRSRAPISVLSVLAGAVLLAPLGFRSFAAAAAGSGGAPSRGGGSSRAASESGIEGQVLLGPTRPSRRVDDKEQDTVPYETAFVVLTAGDRREVARTSSDRDGKFRLRLPPGEYVLAPPAVKKAPPRMEEQQVEVVAGAFTFVTVHFDSGLR